MKILKYHKKADKGVKRYGFFDDDTETIYIRSDLKGYDYLEVLIHEFIHWIIFKLVLHKKLRKFINCVYDMFDSVLWGWDFSFKLVRSYWRDYYAT